MQSLSFHPDEGVERELCINITVHSDDDVEQNETVLVSLMSSDEAVQILTPNTTVIIIDTTGEANCTFCSLQ